MARRIQKKGTSGAAKNYITRTRAVKKLQITLPDFRRLCIFKGIYPREPRKKKVVSKGSTAATTYYYTKDIQYLLHEPLLAKFREHKAVAKKIAKALGRGEAGDAARLEKNLIPKVKLDHIIKERYPTFVDALRDLDDALSMLFLFANLPSHQHVPAKTISLCQRLCHEFEHYVIVSHSLRKSFLSIKGIYYQATIQGQDILWLVPYRFVQRTGGDIDFRIMATFVEFYTTLLGFVNYRLYTSIGLVYPPKFDAKSDERGGELGAFQLQGRLPSAPNGEAEKSDLSPSFNPEAQALADKIAALPDAEDTNKDSAGSSSEYHDDEENTESLDKFEPVAPGGDVLPQPAAATAEVASLFNGLVFFISREAPRAPLEFILRAFGCKGVGWDASLGEGAYTTDESNSSITHQIVDRPPLTEEAGVAADLETASSPLAIPKAQWPRSRMPGRTYVQPQWVWDSINQLKLLPPDIYAPGAELPPHLSPWVKPKRDDYDPMLPIEEQDIEADAVEEEEAIASDAEGEHVFNDGRLHDDVDRESSVEAGEGMEVASSEDDEEEDHDAIVGDADDWDGFESEAESDVSLGELRRRRHQRELEAEALGIEPQTEKEVQEEERAALKKQAQNKRKKEEEAREFQKMMLSNKKRKLLKRIEYGADKKRAEKEDLVRKRRRIEKGKARAEKF